MAWDRKTNHRKLTGMARNPMLKTETTPGGTRVMEPICTIHQRLSKDGLPHVTGSEVRLPSGEVIPYVTSVNVRAVAGETWWEATLTVMARFGEPITGE
jgi:hypothetical protein